MKIGGGGGVGNLGFFADVSEKAKQQQEKNIRVINGNVPFFGGAKSANSTAIAAGLGSYKNLDTSLAKTFVGESNARSKNGAIDEAMRSMRWIMNRLQEAKDGGVAGFVTNASFLRSISCDGVRKTLAKELSALYIMNLRGNQNTQGEVSLKEGGKIFGSSSRVPICVVFMVLKKSKDVEGQGGENDFRLYYYDIGDNKTREEKLIFLAENASQEKFLALGWKRITPSIDGLWLSKRHPDFDGFLPLMSNEVKSKILKTYRTVNTEFNGKSDALSLGGNIPSNEEKSDKDERLARVLFDFYSGGVQANRDAWVCNFSKVKLQKNVTGMIDYYNKQVKILTEKSVIIRNYREIQKTVSRDNSKIKWTRRLYKQALKRNKLEFDFHVIRPHVYRPFTSQYVYNDKTLIEVRFQVHNLFVGEIDNPCIYVSSHSAKDWGVLAGRTFCGTGCLDGTAQMLTMYSHIDGVKRENISDATLQLFRGFYGDKVSRKDIFYYAYGVLNHYDYKGKFLDDLGLGAPRIPFIKKEYFQEFINAGKTLFNLHANYEKVKEYNLQQVSDTGGELPRGVKGKPGNYVKSMHFKKDKNRDKSILYVETIIKGMYDKEKSAISYWAIPTSAHKHKICGRSPIEWVVDRYGGTGNTDKESGLVQDPNDWGIEHGKPGYIISLVKKAITVGIETDKTISNMPDLEYDINEQPMVSLK